MRPSVTPRLQAAQAQDDSHFDSNVDSLLDKLEELVLAGRAGVNIDELRNLPQARPWAFNMKHEGCRMWFALRLDIVAACPPESGVRSAPVYASVCHGIRARRRELCDCRARC